MLDRRGRYVKFFKALFKNKHLDKETGLIHDTKAKHLLAAQFDSFFINCYSFATKANKDSGL
jgi:hypothetical protein